MKKTLKNILKLAAMATMAFALVACGSDEKESSSSSSSSNKKNETPSSKVETSVKTVEDYVESEAFQSELKVLIETYKSQGIEINIEAEGNKLIYSFAYDFSLAGDEETLNSYKTALEQGIESQKSVFVNVANTLADEIDNKDVEVVVSYRDSEGLVIYEQSFKAE